MSDLRVITAHHESGHGAMAYCVGLPFELLTIRPTEHASGRMISYRTAVSSVDALLEQPAGRTRSPATA